MLFGIKRHICAFMQYGDGATGREIYRLAHDLVEQGGCRVCGSVRTGYPADEGGILTYNVVSKGACEDGLC